MIFLKILNFDSISIQDSVTIHVDASHAGDADHHHHGHSAEGEADRVVDHVFAHHGNHDPHNHLIEAVATSGSNDSEAVDTVLQGDLLFT